MDWRVRCAIAVMQQNLAQPLTLSSLAGRVNLSPSRFSHLFRQETGVSPARYLHDLRLDSALMLLSVFAGIAMFGAFGIVIGPVLMIVIVTTISVYLAVYKGVLLEQHDGDETEKSKKRKRRMGWLTRRARKSDSEAPESESDEADDVAPDAAEPTAKPAAP